MIGCKTSSALVACVVLLVPASNAKACGLWNKWFGTPTTTFYAPYTAAYAPAGCGQTVNYMPQTSFRTVFVNTPVVSYSPVAACDACGRATTVMRPVVTYAMQQRVVPYTTFRPVVTAAPVAACCGQTAVAAPVAVAVPAVTQATYAAPMAPAAPCCGGASAAPSLLPVAPAGAPGASVPSLAPTLNYAPSSAPATTYPSTTAYPPATTYPSTIPPSTTAYPPATTYPAPATGPVQPAPAPSTLQPQADPNLQAPPSQSTPPKTFDNGQEEKKPESRLLLPGRTDPAATGGLHGLDPETQDRVTAVPLRPAYGVRTASAVTVSRSAAPAQPVSAWRSARP